jgi:hypothetical protein
MEYAKAKPLKRPQGRVQAIAFMRVQRFVSFLERSGFFFDVNFVCSRIFCCKYVIWCCFLDDFGSVESREYGEFEYEKNPRKM